MYRFELRPNSSLSPRAATFFFLSIAAMALGVAGGLAWVGFWPVLPFAGLEVAGLGAAFWVTQRRASVRELVQVDEDRVTFRREGLGQCLEREFRRPWVRLEMRRAPIGHWPSRLVLASHGRSVEVGAFLTEEERVALNARLGGVLAGRAERPYTTLNAAGTRSPAHGPTTNERET